jgi:hypothetical protein
MLRSRTFALLLAIAMLALPATSLAQSAGDDQYQDPLAGQTGGNGGKSGSNGSTGSTGSTGSAPSTPAPAAATDPATSGTPQASAAQSGTLPRTGFDVVLTIELGLAMLLTGIVAQRMIVLRDRADR